MPGPGHQSFPTSSSAPNALGGSTNGTVVAHGITGKSQAEHAGAGGHGVQL